VEDLPRSLDSGLEYLLWRAGGGGGGGFDLRGAGTGGGVMVFVPPADSAVVSEEELQ
jgi:hypothetical protein